MSEREEIQKVTDKAVEASFEHADDEWRKMALDCVEAVCFALEEFTVNDVRALVNKSPLTTHDNRAMGGVMKTAKSMGWIKASGHAIISKIGHKSPLQVWKSMLFKGQKGLFKKNHGVEY